ncbi:MAG: hypothetical protein R6U02_02010 [Alkalibacterium sp.]|uniref:hypothetical protein n=1 Tax=Alkalibacterium sp. TaxID=1872447 RepID=UPI0039708D32
MKSGKPFFVLKNLIGMIDRVARSKKNKELEPKRYVDTYRLGSFKLTTVQVKTNALSKFRNFLIGFLLF